MAMTKMGSYNTIYLLEALIGCYSEQSQQSPYCELFWLAFLFIIKTTVQYILHFCLSSTFRFRAQPFSCDTCNVCFKKQPVVKSVDMK